jgi:hypothetical protein
MTRAAAALVAATAAATALLPATAVPARPATGPRGPVAHAAAALSLAPLGVDAVTTTSAVLRTSVTLSVLGGTVSFQYGKTTAYGLATASATTSLLGIAEEIRIPVTGLTPGTTYHFRPVARALLSTTYGADQWFTTSVPGAPPAPPAQGIGADPAAAAPAAPPADPGAPATPAPTGSGTASDPGAPATTTPAADPAAPTADAPVYHGPDPVLGESVGLQAVKGVVTVLGPSGQRVTLDGAESLPMGTIVDATNGVVALTSALDHKGTRQTGQFWGGAFEVRQSASGRGLTELVLRGGDFTGCPPATPGVAGASVRHSARLVAHAARASRPPRALWGSDKGGRFQTRGRGSVATVRGTRWVTEDWCRGTVTRVLEGAVAVDDLHLHRTHLVRAGRRYLARADG